MKDKEVVIVEVFHNKKWLGFIGHKKKEKWPIETDSMKARAVKPGKSADRLKSQFLEFMRDRKEADGITFEEKLVPK